MDTHFEKIRKVPAYRVLAEAITERILDGTLRAGDPLPTEARLCEMFGVNRSTVREGIRALEEANLLRREHPRKLVISHPTDREAVRYFERALILQEVSFMELWEAMVTFEPTMAALAAERRNAGALARLEENVRATRMAVLEERGVVEMAIEFQRLVAEMSGNRVLVLARAPASHLFFPFFHAVITRVPTAKTRLVKAHQEILACIVRRDATGAQTWMRRHVDDFRRGAERAGIDVHATVQVAQTDHADRKP
jgi:DNA-binding FadR family transcriptional regulator